MLPVAAAIVSRDMARGVLAYHVLGLAQRDVKPDNYLVAVSPGHELGHTFVLHDNTHTVDVASADAAGTVGGSFVGTEGYRPPEAIPEARIDGKEVGVRGIAPGKAMDVWALGITLTEMMHSHSIQNDRTLDGPDRLCACCCLCGTGWSHVHLCAAPCHSSSAKACCSIEHLPCMHMPLLSVHTLKSNLVCKQGFAHCITESD